jgi:hypothetical protein
MYKCGVYQSPIMLNKRDSIHIHQPLEIIGTNHHAIFDASSKIFIIHIDQFYINTLDIFL